MFLVIMDDLPAFIQHHLDETYSKDTVMTLYADDINHTLCYKEVSALSEMGTQSINLVKQRCYNNKLALNLNKTCVLHFH